MNGLQQGVKWFAIALAAVIICAMVTAMAGGLWLLSAVFDEAGAGEISEVEVVTDVDGQEEIDDLDIKLKAANLEIKSGSELKVETDDDEVKTTWQGNKLTVRDENSHWFFGHVDTHIIIYVPEDMKLEMVKVEAGAGQVVIERLVATRVDLDLGAGRTEIGELVASESAKVKSGAGALEIKGGELAKLDFNMGVGRASVRSRLMGDSKIDAGVGKLELTLLGVEDDYRVEVDQGIGGMTQEGISLRNPKGKNLVKINGGVGAIVLRLEPAEAREN